MRRTKTLPVEFDGLFPRQRELIRVIFVHGGATASEVHSLIPDPPPSVCGIRTLLNRLVRKGLLTRRRSGRHSEMFYMLTAPIPEVRLNALDRIAKEYFGGSKPKAVEALVKLAANEIVDNQEVRSQAA